jgi:serine protease Do
MQSIKNYGRTLWTNLRNGRLSTTFAVLAALTIGVLAGSLITGKVSAGGQQGVDSSDARPLVIPNPVTLSNGFSAIAKQVGPAVVNINTEELPKQSVLHKKRTPGGDDGDQGDNDPQDFFRRFFGGQNPGGDDGEGADGGERRALGSGFIVDPRGYIITNNHVVDKADHIYVKLSTDPDGGPGDEGREATVVGVDKDTDIAVIKIDPKGLTLPTVKLGNSDGAQVGDWVLAIGSPFGLSQTVSAGIVSCEEPLHRRAQPQRRLAVAVPEVHPNRRRHQPRQLRGPAGRYGRTGHRHEHRHLHPVGGLGGHRLRHAVQHPDQRLQHADRAGA